NHPAGGPVTPVGVYLELIREGETGLSGRKVVLLQHETGPEVFFWAGIGALAGLIAAEFVKQVVQDGYRFIRSQLQERLREIRIDILIRTYQYEEQLLPFRDSDLGGGPISLASGVLCLLGKLGPPPHSYTGQPQPFPQAWNQECFQNGLLIPSQTSP